MLRSLRPLGLWSRLRWIGWITLGAVVVAGALVVRQQLVSVSTETITSSRARFGTPGGSLVIAGGGALPPSIPQRFVELAGGARGRLVVLPAAPLDDQRVSDSLHHWSQFGLQQVDLLQADSRSQSDDPEFSTPLLKATAVWLSGGQQTWLTAWYRDTLIHRRVLECCSAAE